MHIALTDVNTACLINSWLLSYLQIKQDDLIAIVFCLSHRKQTFKNYFFLNLNLILVVSNVLGIPVSVWSLFFFVVGIQLCHSVLGNWGWTKCHLRKTCLWLSVTLIPVEISGACCSCSGCSVFYISLIFKLFLYFLSSFYLSTKYREKSVLHFLSMKPLYLK